MSRHEDWLGVGLANSEVVSAAIVKSVASVTEWWITVDYAFQGSSARKQCLCCMEVPIRDPMCPLVRYLFD